jgi:hypothetical protein
MRRKTTEPTVLPAPEYQKGAVRTSHPAFGTAVVSRGTGSGRALFQSDILHNETITLRISQAERTRDLNHDWVHGENKNLIEIEMSLAQWGALISSQGIGSGTPVTIRATETNPFVDGLPFEPRIAENLKETRGAVDRLLEGIKQAQAKLDDAIDNKRGVKAVREAQHTLKYAIQNATANSAFAIKSLTEAAEHVTSQAKADIESHILNASRLTGLPSPIEAPTLGIVNAPLEIEGSTDDGR